MFILSRISGVVLFALFFLGKSVLAAPSCALEGIVKDANGAPLQSAQIYIKGKEGSNFVKVVKTDAAGRYAYSGLGTGPYIVTLVVNDTIKPSIANVQMRTGDTEKLNFDLQKGAPARPFTKGKHYVWVPSITGSHLGAWIEVDDNDKQMPIGMQERIRNQGNQQAKTWQANGAAMPNHM